jgi:hypothetical protein
MSGFSRPPGLASSHLPGPPHRIKRASKNAIVDDDLRTFIKRQTCPVHKLRWKADLQSPYWKEVFKLLDDLPQGAKDC